MFYPDALFLKAKVQGNVRNSAVYLALGIDKRGEKGLVGLGLSRSEGPKFWIYILTELKNRGIQDILIAYVNGHSGLPDAIESISTPTEPNCPSSTSYRNAVNYISWKE